MSNIESHQTPLLAETPRRIVITTFGSYGDLHPYIAIGLGLQARGHSVVMATSEYYRGKITALGLGFHATRPDSDWVADPKVMRRLMDYRMGTVRAVLEKFLPGLRDTYEDLLAATQGADVVVSHMPWAARFVAEKTGIPWVSTMITPFGFFSAYDLPVFPPAPGISKALRPYLSPPIWTTAFRVLRWIARPWARQIYRVRTNLGLPACRDWNPLGDSHSPQLVLGLFSPVLGPRQPDWPPNTMTTGFPVFDQDGEAGLPAELERFLDSGPPPIVFTLAMSASMVAARFFQHSISAAQQLGRRAILITGRNPQNRQVALPAGIAAFEYAPFSKLFPRAAAIVHPGGIGTTGLGMRSGRPTLIVPFAHDQPDNADRLERLGISRTLSRHHYKSNRVVSELRQLLDDPRYTLRASEIAEQIQPEDGVSTACAAIEAFLNQRK